MQPQRAGALRFEIRQRLHAARRVGRRRTQQFAEFVRGARGEAAECAAGEARDLAERFFADRVITFLEHEGPDVTQAEFASARAYLVKRFLHGVADKDERRDFPFLGFAPRMGQNLADLGVAAPTIDARHQAAEPARLGDPRRSAALREPAIINQLNIEAADGAASRNMSPCSLHALSQVGCRLMVASSAKISRPRCPVRHSADPSDLTLLRKASISRAAMAAGAARLVGRRIAGARSDRSWFIAG